ncbi:TPA: hypothetical protein TVR14_000431 [Streptococcus equi subsp. zooepidemicus]|uniref:hypothetical protein n=1 Tax=Streptococcus equi TaxID=1336 RepID=UPI0005B9BF8E|nr:hypothetical protein [Streptococcus equi]HEL0726946.1 hypothetical protein [Streptococcus equi subsp. zooepidemicus]KIS11564.1 hypothetical protein AT51_00477 [Streptococcus equi subsp. zooepidemicus Sz57]HEL1077937.1 hypothetical protein [Streptococcus equi subsp. zooepidemicus]HEL1208966.1 hypothetical protein [Streptococcus equi subsp. zooepidemicus]HEL1266547.1 hypothetical protein [Streptococcus equi subsp. zooepidemicus]
MDWNTIALATITALFIIGLTLIALADEEEETPKNETSDFFTEEELALVEFLETRQAINEDFLVAQKKLLETLNHERRHF